MESKVKIKTEKRFINIYSRFRAAFLMGHKQTYKGIEKSQKGDYFLKFSEGSRKFLITHIGCTDSKRKLTKKRLKRIKRAMKCFEGARHGLPCELLDTIKAMEKYYAFG